jgi:excisionase family DNA binding protein
MNPSILAAAQSLHRVPVDIVSTLELSWYLKCDRKTIERLVTKGVLVPIRVGRNYRFSRADVLERLTRAA